MNVLYFKLKLFYIYIYNLFIFKNLFWITWCFTLMFIIMLLILFFSNPNKVGVRGEKDKIYKPNITRINNGGGNNRDPRNSFFKILKKILKKEQLTEEEIRYFILIVTTISFFMIITILLYASSDILHSGKIKESSEDLIKKLNYSIFRNSNTNIMVNDFFFKVETSNLTDSQKEQLIVQMSNLVESFLNNEISSDNFQNSISELNMRNFPDSSSNNNN